MIGNCSQDNFVVHQDMALQTDLNSCVNGVRSECSLTQENVITFSFYDTEGMIF